MFERVKYKRYAKSQLKGRMLVPAGATLICLVIFALIDFEFTENPAVKICIILIKIAVSGILAIAFSLLFLSLYQSAEKPTFMRFVEGFSLFAKGIFIAFWSSLWIFLWSLLLVIPGIVKAFSYSQTAFVIAENPSLSASKALRLSKIITKGFKADLFFMCLSFLGWDILSLFSLGILQLWLIPYKMMSFTNAYKSMKAHALRRGELSAADFSAEYQ